MKSSIENLYSLDGRVPVGKALPFGLQHILAMFVSNITPIMILSSAIGLDSAVSAMLIQNCMIIAGIGTLVQLYPIWRIGSRLPIVMGISFTFLSLSISIASVYGMGTLIGAVIIGGLIEGVLGLFAKYWVKLIPHVVAATAFRFFLLVPTLLPVVRAHPTLVASTTGLWAPPPYWHASYAKSLQKVSFVRSPFSLVLS